MINSRFKIHHVIIATIIGGIGGAVIHAIHCAIFGGIFGTTIHAIFGGIFGAIFFALSFVLIILIDKLNE